MNFSTWFGFAIGIGVMLYGLEHADGISVFLNPHGIILVLGGTFGATLINTPFGRIWSSFKAFFMIFFTGNSPKPDATIQEIMRLKEVARTQGGLFALQNEAAQARKFIKRAVDLAVASGETDAVKDAMELQIKNYRSQRNEQSNVFRTVALLGPMFGLLGTLLGIVAVLRNISDPSKVGPAMAVALSTAFYGISLANLICIPVAGKIRYRMMEEALDMEIIMHGIVGIMENKPAYVLEMELQSFAEDAKKSAPKGRSDESRAA